MEAMAGAGPFAGDRPALSAYRAHALAHAEGQRVKRELEALRELWLARRMQQAQQQQQQ